MSAFASVGMDIVLDMKEVTYISYSYMQAILKIQRTLEQQGKDGVKLIHVPSQILKDFEKIGLSELLWIE